MDAAVRDALIAAGGCQHTPEPYRGCDTCGRTPQPWSNRRGNIAFNWQAQTVDGDTMAKNDLVSISNLPLDKICRLTVNTDSMTYPQIKICVDPRKGERLYHFTRHFESFSADTDKKGHATMLVFEVRYDGDPKRFVRLYLHPIEGPILSTEDMYI